MRPQFHLTAETGWMNDPHAITFRNGRYEVFYQYVPDTLVWSPHCHWAHAVSKDLIQFERRPIALAPDDGDDGIWTGSLAQLDDNRAAIFYTSVRVPDVGIGRIRTATADDQDWLGWTKGPVVAEAPPDLDLIAYRDPFVFSDGERWRMFVGAALANGTAAALSYSSVDLDTWSHDGIAAQRSTEEREPVWTGTLWECPQLFEFDGRHVLVSSVWDDDVLHHTAYAIGRYADGTFDADIWGRLSYGPSYYAPSFYRDAAGRPSLTFWLRGVKDRTAGWAGAHSVPHSLSLDGDRLVATPHARLEGYRGDLADSGHVDGLAADVAWGPEAGGRTLTCSSGGAEVLRLELTDTALLAQANDTDWSMPYDGGSVRLIADGPLAEVSTRCGLLALPLDPAGPHLDIAADGGSLRVWALTDPETVG